MDNQIVFGVTDDGSREEFLLTNMSNRHGCITGATGTGKTVSLQKMAEEFSKRGVPVFLADIKGDLSGLAKAGVLTEKLKARLQKHHLPIPDMQGCPVVFWDVFQEQGFPIRATISDMGPLLLSRLLQLNETQEGVLNAVFSIADDNGLLLLDLKDLRSMLQFVGENASQFKTKYGNISAASIGAIQRGLLVLENQGGALFFGEPTLNIHDLLQTENGKGVINILAADKLMRSPKLYATFLLWILSELYENLPEAGDIEKPKLVFFFDEAHMLFRDAPSVLIEKVEQVVRLIRSKGVGVFFVTQSPSDIPEKVLSQLGNRVQHALRAFTPKDQKAVKTVAETMRPNPKIDMAQAIQQLGVGEALVSFLDENGTPGITQRVWVGAPGSQIGPVTLEERKAIENTSTLKGVYEQAIDRESAYEVLLKKPGGTPLGQEANTKTQSEGSTQAKADEEPDLGDILMQKAKDILLGSTGPRGGRREGIIEKVVRQNGERLLRGVLGSLLEGKK